MARCDELPEPRDRERLDLALEVPLPPLLELASLLEVAAPGLERLPELGHALAAKRLGEQDLRPSFSHRVERDDRSHLLDHRLRGGMVHLVHGDHVGNLHDPGLERLHRVA